MIHSTVTSICASLLDPNNVDVGARAYYLRNIMHDYSDEKCVLILRQIMKAMDKDSVILIDDRILPDQGAHHATQLDLTMIAILGAMERTEKQWRSWWTQRG